jgi:hypothetical protein
VLLTNATNHLHSYLSSIKALPVTISYLMSISESPLVDSLPILIARRLSLMQHIIQMRQNVNDMELIVAMMQSSQQGLFSHLFHAYLPPSNKYQCQHV